MSIKKKVKKIRALNFSSLELALLLAQTDLQHGMYI